MNQIMNNEPLTVFGDGEQTRAFSYIKEISGIIAASPKNRDAYNEVFNIGADTPYTINELVREVGAVFGIVPNVTYLPERNEVKHAYSSHDKVQKYFPILQATH
jgi:UDP-glucose 4-epimerase